MLHFRHGNLKPGPIFYYHDVPSIAKLQPIGTSSKKLAVRAQKTDYKRRILRDGTGIPGLERETLANFVK